MDMGPDIFTCLKYAMRYLSVGLSLGIFFGGIDEALSRPVHHHGMARQPWIKKNHSVENVSKLPDGLHAQPVPQVETTDLTGRIGQKNILFIPTDDMTGVAAFWSGIELIIVADRPAVPWQDIPRHGSIYDQRDVIALNKATVLRIFLPKRFNLHFTKVSGGWLLSPLQTHENICWRVSPQPNQGATLFPFSFMGRIVTLWNPNTGSRNYVATVRQPQCVPFKQKNLGYDIEPALLGAVVQDYDRRIIERLSSRGPLLQMIVPPSIWSDARTDNTHLSGDNNLSQDEVAAFFIQKWHKDEAFLKRIRDRRDELQKNWLHQSHRTKKRRRRPPQPPHLTIPPSLIVQVAQSALWAGHPERTWDVLQSYDLNNASDLLMHRRALLLSYAAVLTGRENYASLLSDPLLGLEPNMAVWHAFYLMRIGYNSEVTSELLTASFPAFMEFPEPLRHIMMPQFAGYLAQFGDDGIRSKLLDMLPKTPEYDYTLSVLYLRKGEKDKAFNLLKRMVASPNSFRTASARALLTYVFMNDGLITPHNAALEEEKLLKGDMGANGQTNLDFDDFSDIASLVMEYHIKALIKAHQPCRAIQILRTQKATGFLPEDQLALLWRSLLKQLIFSPDDMMSAPSLQSVCISTVDNKHQTLMQTMRYLEDRPENAKLLEGYAHFLLKSHRQVEAIPVLLKLEFLTQNPYSRVDTVDKLVNAALQTNSLETASDALQRAHIPELTEDSAYQLKYNEAALEIERGDDEGALLLLGDDQSDDALRMKGRAYEDSGQWERAINTLYFLARRSMGPATSYMEPEQHELVHHIISDVTHLQNYQPPADLLRWNQLPVRSYK